MTLRANCPLQHCPDPVVGLARLFACFMGWNSATVKKIKLNCPPLGTAALKKRAKPGHRGAGFRVRVPTGVRNENLPTRVCRERFTDVLADPAHSRWTWQRLKFNPLSLMPPQRGRGRLSLVVSARAGEDDEMLQTVDGGFATDSWQSLLTAIDTEWTMLTTRPCRLVKGASAST